MERVNVTDKIIEYLKKGIEAGTWQEGEKLPSENQLTRELGVSRASVRTAIQYLTGIGALESVHGKGTYLLNAKAAVSDSSTDVITAKDCRDIAKVLEFRRMIEPQACYLAVEQGDERLVAQLEKWLGEMKKQMGNKSSFVHADIKFHEAICKASGNPLLVKSMTRVFRETKIYHEKMNVIFGYEEGIRYHTMILDAVRGRDEELARNLMDEHLSNGLRNL